VLSAAMAVATGQANYVSVHRGICQSTQNRFGQSMVRGGAASFPEASTTAPFGQLSPAHMFALQARRHMHMYGTSIETFAEIAMAERACAVNNPNARFRTPMTMDDYLNSRMIAEPLRLLDCCLESDGAGALIVTTPERARDLKQKPVAIASASVGAPYRWGMGGMGGANMLEEDYASAGQRTVAEHLYRKSGLKPADVDVAMIYDHFTPMVAMGIEDFGFCKKGEAKDFVKDGRIRMGGALPINTHGGNLSEVYLHGITHFIEGVRQIRGTSFNQVKDAEVALVVAGSSPTPTSAVLLTR
jgi:acetyl-CoA acetyltransferase